MDFSLDSETSAWRERLGAFMNQYVYPAEELAHQQAHASSSNGYHDSEVIADLRSKAKAAGLWNLFLPDKRYGKGLTNAQYAPLAEIMGRSPIGPRVFNCAAPDTGNMEILAEFGSEEQKRRWLIPALEGEIRTCFSMTEPETPGSDPTQLRTRAVCEGDYYTINGHKWFTTGAFGSACAIVMAVTDPDAAPHRRATMIVVPLDTPGMKLVRSIPVVGTTGGNHAEILYKDCRVPISNRLGEEGSGFAIAQARLGPGRIHHCMRAVGVAERALELMCQRASTRWTHGSLLAEKANVQQWIADSRIEIDATRLMVMNAAWKIDTLGKRQVRQEVAMIKVMAANMVMRVLDRAIQLFGAMGLSDDTPIAQFWRVNRVLRIGDGPDEVHRMTIARRELRKLQPSS